MSMQRRPDLQSNAKPDRRTGGAVRAHPGTHVTKTQAAAYESFMRTHSMSETARELSLCVIRIRELLIQYQRNLARDQGQRPPPLKAMLRGDVSTRFSISRDVRQGRPAKHHPPQSVAVPADPSGAWSERPRRPRAVTTPARGVRRLLVTAAEGGAPAHAGFVANLAAYAEHLRAEIVVLRSDHADLGPTAPELLPFETRRPVDVGGRLDLRPDVALPRIARSPLERMERASPGRWAAFAHPTFQLSSLPRLRGQPARLHMTTGVATLPVNGGEHAQGALVVEVATDGAVFARHLQAGGDGAFHDLDVRVSGGRVQTGLAVEALILGDIHHARIDPEVVAATWGEGPDDARSLVGRLRPRTQVMHDVADFMARNHHDRSDPHARFLRHATGTANVRREMEGVAGFLAATRRPWSRTVVVHSNHDDMLTRWLREADPRSDPENAEYHLDRQRALLMRLRAGAGTSSFLAETLRELADDRLEGVRFLGDGESLLLADVECGVHGHAAADGVRGSLSGLERLGIDMVVGHSHRPTAAGGIYVTGVCQLDMGYNRGPSTWAVAHVVLHADGSRQHVFMEAGRFLA